MTTTCDSFPLSCRKLSALFTICESIAWLRLEPLTVVASIGKHPNHIAVLAPSHAAGERGRDAKWHEKAPCLPTAGCMNPGHFSRVRRPLYPCVDNITQFCLTWKKLATSQWGCYSTCFFFAMTIKTSTFYWNAMVEGLPWCFVGRRPLPPFCHILRYLVPLVMSPVNDCWCYFWQQYKNWFRYLRIHNTQPGSLKFQDEVFLSNYLGPHHFLLRNFFG